MGWWAALVRRQLYIEVGSAPFAMPSDFDRFFFLKAEHQDCTSSVTQLQQLWFGLRRPEALWVPSGAAPRVADLKLSEKVECGCHSLRCCSFVRAWILTVNWAGGWTIEAWLFASNTIVHLPSRIVHYS
ncbi:unnamed protein product [Prunus armeniaca]|uniref:Uncharacterized protein n=1 Tax=Prunus armeniaca TaxID=36596 RepID=A0A6J5WF33_PRUAR|nr:unnamed protein product [Prunus armeniaca]